MCPLGFPSMGCPLLSIAFTRVVIERVMASRNLIVDRTDHEGPKRVFQPLCLLVTHLQATKGSRAD